jgi:hypothetical protein
MNRGRSDFESVKLLCQSVLRKLESQRMIAVEAENRNFLLDELSLHIKSQILTQEDMEAHVLSQIGTKSDELNDLHLTGGEAYRTLRQQWLSKHGEYEVDGLYFQKPIKYVAEWVIQFLLKSANVDEVFADDDKLLKTIVASIGNFRRSKLH